MRKLLIGMVSLCVSLVHCKKTEKEIELSCHPFSVNTTGQVSACLTEKALVISKNEKQEEFLFKDYSCLSKDVDSLYLFPDGETVYVYGMRANMDFDLFGHAGHHISADCLIHLKTKKMVEHPFGTPQYSRGVIPEIYQGSYSQYIYQWPEKNRINSEAPISIFDQKTKNQNSLSLQHGSPSQFLSSCDLVETATTTKLACIVSGFGEDGVDQKKLIVAQYDFKEWPFRFNKQDTFPLPRQLEIKDIRFSPSGNYIALWGKNIKKDHLQLIDLTKSKVAFFQEETFDEYGGFQQVAFDPSDEKLFLGLKHSGDIDSSNEIRELDLTGKNLNSMNLKNIRWLDKLFWSSKNKLWVTNYATAYLVDLSKK